ncbi:DUF3021 domain-containing protein [Companilactobacillus sp.]|uniref:DUF3021 domain-containing protein n=1 Tax=Companilactobacillus sp. TaxID=2767905 RepID=UPI002634BDD4|nr:DUF3021 domain-containing protein [Companilactobacillus sp.]
MRKFRQLLTIGFLGMSIGIFVGFIWSLLFSFIYQSKSLMPSSPMFYERFSSLTVATAVSAVLWAAMGMLFAYSGLVFRIEKWSITRMTITHFLIVFCVFTPLAVLAGWFPLTVYWFLFYILVFIISYSLSWIISMMISSQRVNEVNAAIKQSRQR